MRQGEQIGVRLVREFGFSWNLGLGLRHEAAQIRVVPEGNLGAVGVRLRRVHRTMPGALDVTCNTLGAVFARLFARHLAPFDAVEIIHWRSICSFACVGRRKDGEVLAPGGFERFGDSNDGRQRCCGAGFAGVDTEEGVEVVVDGLDLFRRWFAHGFDGWMVAGGKKW